MNKLRLIYKLSFTFVGVCLLCANVAAQTDLRDPPALRHHIGSDVTLGFDAEVDAMAEWNFDLDRRVNEDAVTAEAVLGMGMVWAPLPPGWTFVDLELGRRYLLDVKDGTPRPRTTLGVQQAYVAAAFYDGNVGVQVGRQSFNDEREWLYDEKLDAVRGFAALGPLRLEAAVGRVRLFERDLLNRDRPARRVNNYFLTLRYPVTEDWEVSGYYLRRDDREPRRPEDLTFVGIRSFGELGPIDHWLEVGVVRGHFRDQEIRGFAIDLGGTWVLRTPYRPALTLGAAFGSGDNNRRDGVDRNYRQTGLQDNNGKHAGVTSFKLYGELVDPELSNLLVTTLGIGIRPTRRSSLDFVHHAYVQHRAHDDLRDTNLDRDPNAEQSLLGHELDLVVGYRELEDLRLELVLGAFFPGPAYRGMSRAYFASFEAKYDF